MAITFKRAKRDDVVGTTLSEIVLFLLFSCLILLGATLDVWWERDPDGADEPGVTVEGVFYPLPEIIILIGELKDIAEDLAGRLASTENELIVVQTENTGLSNQVETLEGKNADLQGQIVVLVGQRDDALGALGEANEEIERLNAKIIALRADVAEAEREISKLRLIIRDLNRKRDQVRNDKPFTIVLRDSENYRFPSGKATMSSTFRSTFAQEALDELQEAVEDAKAKGKKIVIEVVGHTDEQPVSDPWRRKSGLDLLSAHLLPLNQGLPPNWVPPEHVDNVGLGMARAATVTRMLLEYQQGSESKWLDGIPIVPLSAGQMIRSDNSLARQNRFSNFSSGEFDDADRRRIEIRLREIE